MELTSAPGTSSCLLTVISLVMLTVLRQRDVRRDSFEKAVQIGGPLRSPLYR